VLEFLSGGGEMGARIRAFPWTKTSLGSPGAWPQGLRTALRVLLTTQHPVFIFWGPEHLCFYNDAYSRSLGPEKHPHMLGAPGRDWWGEIWPIIGPQIEQVLRGGAATWHENQLVPIIRHGQLQDVYWTYSFGPIDELDAPNGVGGVLVICTETTQQVLTERRLAAERESFAQLFEQAPSFMAVLRGPEHRFELANPGYMRLIGHREILGKPLVEALPEAIPQGYLELLDQVYRSGKAYSAIGARYDAQLSPQGPAVERYVDFVFQPITDADGSVSGIFVEGFDSTSRNLAELALQDANRRKDEFLAMLAHELRNPLAPIRTAAEILARTLPEEADTYAVVNMLRRQASQLTRLVDDLLDVSRISQGRIELKRETLNVASLIDQAFETVGPLFQEKRQQVSLAPSYEPLHVIGDVTRLVQSLVNVLTNAAKYTERGGNIRIQTRGSADDVFIDVSDSGAGLPAELIPHIFEMFVQGDRTLDRAQGGLGIGLAVVKKLIEMHGGQITARSEGLGCGSTFELRLPRARAAAATDAAAVTAHGLRRLCLNYPKSNPRGAASSAKPTASASRAAHLRPPAALADRGADARAAGRPAHRAVGRRAKYLLLRLERGTVILHLGMSGSLRILPGQTERLKHDQFDLLLDRAKALRFNDPRRFGSLHYTTEDPAQHKLLRSLAPEPLESVRCRLSASHHARASRRHQAGADERAAGHRRRQHLRQRSAVSRPHQSAARRAAPVACRLRPPGALGARDAECGHSRRRYHAARLRRHRRQSRVFSPAPVCLRARRPACRVCGTVIRRIKQGQRSTYYCPQLPGVRRRAP
jgi:signal transduction histidine kinase